MAERYLIPSKTIDNLMYTPSDEEDPLTFIERDLASSYWKEDEVRLRQDEIDWKTSDLIVPSVKNLLITAITEFNLFDILVMMQLSDDGFVSEITNIQMRTIYATVAHFEALHSVVYAKLARAIMTPEELYARVNPQSTEIVLSQKVAWYVKNMTRHYDPSSPGSEEHLLDHARRVVTNCAVEGMFFSSKFCSIYWVKRLGGILPGIITSNEWIARDEALHCKLAAIYYKKLGSPLPREEVIRIVSEAAELECAGVLLNHPKDLPGLSQQSLCDYIRYNCNYILSLLLGTKITHYDVENHYDWMNSISLPAQTNFFEKDVSDYQVASIDMKAKVTILEDF